MEFEIGSTVVARGVCELGERVGMTEKSGRRGAYRVWGVVVDDGAHIGDGVRGCDEVSTACGGM